MSKRKIMAFSGLAAEGFVLRFAPPWGCLSFVLLFLFTESQVIYTFKNSHHKQIKKVKKRKKRKTC